MKLIGLTGPARCGKDITANLFERYGYTKAAFAGPLKSMLCTLLGMSPKALEDLKDHTLDFLGCTPRILMQTLGTEWGRQTVSQYMSEGPSIWLRFMDEKISLMKDMEMMNPEKDEPKLVITDVRFEDEAALIRHRGGAIIHISRDNRSTIGTAAHTSEDGIHLEHTCDYRLNNNTSMDDLAKRVDVLCQMIDIDQPRYK